MRRHPGAVVAALAAAALMAGCGGEEPGQNTDASSRAADTPSTPSSPPEASAGEEQRSLAPEHAVALRTRQPAGLVELDTATGEVVRDFDVDLGEGAGSLTYSPARGSVFFTRTATGARQEVVERALDDGAAEVRAVGNAVAVAPDGDRLAVARRVLDDRGDSERVQLEVPTIEGEVVGQWTDGSLHDRSQQVPAPGDLRMLAAPSYRPGSGRLAVVDRPGLDPEARQRWRILTLDPATHDVHDVLTTTERAVTGLDFEVSGEHLVYVQSHAHPDPGQGDARPPELYRWHDGAATRVAEGITETAW